VAVAVAPTARHAEQVVDAYLVAIGCNNAFPTDSALKFAATLILGALP
jgi:hypothetical protein